jgi:exosortase
MTTAIKSKPATKSVATTGRDTWKVLVPYGLAILAQLPMLLLYFRDLWARPHYQPFSIAILATIGLAFYRWPFDQERPFYRSLASNILLALGLGAAFLGLIFVEPWFSALSLMLIVTSLFARTMDKESGGTLWPCALPLYVYLVLPNGMDFRLITKLQQYSAIYTSRLLDLAGLGHHMNGTVIKVPGQQEYGIEQACSGVQSFFTLLLVAVIFIVMSRRLNVPRIGPAILSIIAGISCFVFSAMPFISEGWSEALLLIGVGFLFQSVMGFRAAALILSAVFWAVFMNTIRILVIPMSEFLLDLDLSHGFAHDVLGYSALALGILLLFSTDQFLLFMFGPVEPSSAESGPFGSSIARFWNGVLSGSTEEGESDRRRRRQGRQPITNRGRTFIWVASGLMVLFGAWQVFDVQKSFAQTDDLLVRFFDDNVMVDFGKDDMPENFDTWEQVNYEMEQRFIGSDLGQRSDVWQFRSPTCAAVVSLDQTFPGWHELTTCYQNQGWKLVENGRARKYPSELVDVPEGDQWTYIEAKFEKSTGEKGYLLFSHFDAMGEGMNAPENWGTLNSFLVRAKNRMSHRIRAQLFQGEAYQIQVFLTSFNDLDEELIKEVNLRYLEIREQIRERFRERRKQQALEAK